MKRVLSALAALAALVMGSSAVSAQQVKIGYINSQQVLAQANIVTQARQRLETEIAGFRTRADSLARPLQQRGEEFERQRSTMPQAAQQQREQQLRGEFQQVQQQVQAIEQQAAQRQAAVMDPIMKQVSDAIEAVRREGGFLVILDAAAVVAPNDATLDITQRVLTRLNGAAAPAR
jgi:outer membrane protein